MPDLAEEMTVQELIHKVRGLLAPLPADEIDARQYTKESVLIVDATNYREAMRLWDSLVTFCDDKDHA